MGMTTTFLSRRQAASGKAAATGEAGRSGSLPGPDRQDWREPRLNQVLQSSWRGSAWT